MKKQYAAAKGRMDGSHGRRIGVTEEEQYMGTCAVTQRQKGGGCKWVYMKKEAIFEKDT